MLSISVRFSRMHLICDGCMVQCSYVRFVCFVVGGSRFGIKPSRRIALATYDFMIVPIVNGVVGCALGKGGRGGEKQMDKDNAVGKTNYLLTVPHRAFAQRHDR